MQLNSRNQDGVALLIFIILVALAAITYYFSTISSAELQIDQKQKTAEVLKQAKAALIEYALVNSYVNSPSGEFGKLPCPDYINNAVVEGAQDASCGNAYANGIGFFPWKEIGVNVLKDSSGTCLLYAVSPAYKSSPSAALNPDSYGQFNIVDSADNVILGNAPEDRPVAIIFAPGEALSGQIRTHNGSYMCGGDYGNISAYLDNNGVINNAAINTGVDNVIDKFAQAAPRVNDRLITISSNDIWKPLLAALNRNNFFAINGTMYKVTEAISMCMAAYGNHNGNHLPMPAALNLNGGEYRRDVDYDDSSNFTTAYAGRLPYDTSNANGVLPGTNTQYLLGNTYCDHLDLASTTTISEDIIWSDSNGEYRQLWSNWKDHFFYVVSKAYSPAGSLNCSAGCVSVGGVAYAGIIFFSGLKTGSQQRYSPPFDVDDKANISNYLEEGRDTQFPDNAGAGIYPSVNTAVSNDIMFCIKTDMSVIPCP